eukprot:12588929-Ditylum_brightwellii.AAC.1
MADVLAFDQQLKLCIIAGMRNNPLRFYFTLETLATRHRDPSNDFEFQACVMYDWIDFSIQTWGDWRGGGDDHLNRYLPSGLINDDWDSMFSIFKQGKCREEGTKN